VVLAVVAGGHLCAVVLWIMTDTVPQQHESDAQTALEVILVPASTQKSAAAVPKLNAARTSHRQHMRALPPTSPAAQSGHIAPQVDWTREAESVARARAAEIAPEHTCDDGDRPGSTLPKCKQGGPAFQWDPEPSRFGVQGLIPYVRLGKHCVLGLGFFGCALGKLPEANGKLFDDLKDPGRPQGSVPDVRMSDR
jgi:hypothetical protein